MRLLLAALAASFVMLSAAQAQVFTAAPPGFDAFCWRNPSFCSHHQPTAAPLSDLALLNSVNAQVNDRLLPDPLASDEAKRAQNQNWRIPAPGDLAGCIEYMLAKYEWLAWSGIDRGAMRFAEVRIRATGQLHAVLLVDIGKTVVAMDCLHRVVLPPDSLNYDWLAVQDAASGYRWIKPDGPPAS